MMDLKRMAEEALQIVTQGRNEEYGQPEDSFFVIAVLWNAYLEIKKNERLTEADVARMMQLLKMARRITAPATKEDSLIDAIGYVLCEAQCDSDR